ncbi:MAG: hypothetical protein ACOY3Y_08360, partial [Acidobacteriota bacterium]
LAVGTPEGWTLHDSRTLPDDWATAAVPFAGGLAVGTYASGLALVGPSGVEPLAPALWVNAGALASTGSLLAAGVLDGGLFLHDATSTRTLGTPDGLPDADVTDVIADGQAGLWVATRGGLAHVGPAPRAEE